MGKVEPSGSGERCNPLLSSSSSSFGVMVVVFGQDSNRRECVQEFLCHILVFSPTIESIDKVDQIDRPLVVGWFSDPNNLMKFKRIFIVKKLLHILIKN